MVHYAAGQNTQITNDLRIDFVNFMDHGTLINKGSSYQCYQDLSTSMIACANDNDIEDDKDNTCVTT